jgi:hypothetical protein
MTGDDLGQRVQEVMTKAEATVERPVSPSGAGAKGLNHRGFMVALVGASGTMLVGCVDLGNTGLGLKLASLAVDEDNTTRPVASAGGRADSRGARRRGSLRLAADRQEDPSRPARRRRRRRRQNRRRRRTRDRDD